MANRIVSVWLDETSNDEDGWIVDTDTTEGGQSDTLKVFPGTDAGFDRAVSYAKRAGIKRGCDVHLHNGMNRIVLADGEYDAD